VNLSIRRAEPDDVPALVTIENESFASPNWNGRDFLKYECYVAEIDGNIAGFLVSRELFGGDADSPPQREILNVAVAPVHRRRGVATALISHQLTEPGQLFLEVRESNVAAQKLYQKLGFIEVARRSNYYSSPVETAIVMNMK
jgi:[ribosomal protein S18]-alanine N-acetyltransferase